MAERASNFDVQHHSPVSQEAATVVQMPLPGAISDSDIHNFIIMNTLAAAALNSRSPQCMVW